MRLRHLLLVLACSPALAHAQDADGAWSFEGNVTAASDFVWRGISQTDGDAALQAEAGVAHASGVYAGIWASRVKFTSPGDEDDGIDHEVDYTLGWARELADGIELDLSATRARYPGALPGYDVSYTEYVASLSFAGHYTAAVAYSPDIFRLGGKGIYYSAAAEYPLGDSGFGLKLQTGWYDLDDAAGDSYGDYMVGVTRAFGPIDAELQYTDTFSYGQALSDNLDDASKADGRISLLLGWSF